MSTNSYDEAYDARKYKCPPWFGEAGAQFTQTFSPNFLSALDQIADDFNTLAQHLQQEDFGSPNNPHANAGTAAIQAKSVLAYNLRIVKCISLMRAHVENTELRKVIDFLKANPPAGPGISLAVTIWQRMILEGTLQSSSLNILNQEYDWTNLKLSNVGQNDRSMTALRSVIDTVNGEREDPKTDENCRRRSIFPPIPIRHRFMLVRLLYYSSRHCLPLFQVESLLQLCHERQVQHADHSHAVHVPDTQTLPNVWWPHQGAPGT